MFSSLHNAFIPLSLSQEWLWALTQQAGNSGDVYHIYRAYRLKGKLNSLALEKSIHEIIARHEMLRAYFVKIDDQLYQQIAGISPFELSRVNLQVISIGEQKARLQQLLNEEVHHPFALESGPLLRIKLFRSDEEDHTLLIVIHSLIFDSWSLNLFWDELTIFYEAYVRDVPVSPLSPPIQYTDYIEWEQKQTENKQSAVQLKYWKQQLVGAAPLLVLPTNKRRPAVQRFRGSVYTFHLSNRLTQALKELSDQQNVTLFTTLLTAFDILLYRYTNQVDILVGTPITNRNRTELEKTIGLFVNSLVLRANLSGNPTFRNLLDRVHQVVLSAYDHQSVSFIQLVQILRPNHDLSYHPLFQVMFDLQNKPGLAPKLPGIALEPIDISRETTQFDLSLYLVETEQGLEANLEYNTDLFEPEAMMRMAGHLEQILEGITADPNQTIGLIPILTGREQHQLLIEWSGTKRKYPQEKCLHQLFEAQVERTPEALAVVFKDHKLTYWELNQRANRLAGFLKRSGVGAEVLVGICMERSIQMIVGILGILKAGGAYVPLDPNYPRERQIFISRDAKLKIILTTGDTLRGWSEHQTGFASYDIDQLNRIEGYFQADDDEARCFGNQPAYVLYTSGSTGVPKGVLIEHQSVLAMLFAFEGVAPADRHLAGTFICPYSFDVSVWEIFSCLCFGGVLHILSLDMVALPKHFARYLIENRISSAYIPPPLLSDLVVELEKQSQHITLKRILVGVEPIQQSVLQRLRQSFAQLYIINGYGPTETTVCATFYSFQAALSLEQPTPIGSALSNYQIYIVDDNFQPVPIQVAGEVLIGGKGLARGYVNHPSITAEHFVPNPFGQEAGGRLYRTGDFARYLPDGNIEFLGRLDSQVKIRGFRIELGEIESVLAQNSAVAQAVVILQENEPGHKYLKAYVSFNKESECTIPELRSFLQKRLPVHMLPSSITLLDSLPITPNGKINRQLLLNLENSDHEWEVETCPRTPVENLLAGIWTNVLGVSHVGIYDNFFDLGGHSLKAIHIILRIQDLWQVKLTLQDIFDQPTVANLAKKIENSLKELSQEQYFNKKMGHFDQVPISPRPGHDRIPLSFAQQRIWFLDQLYPNQPIYNIAISAHITGNLDISALEKSLVTLIGRHESLRTIFTVINEEPYQTVLKPTDSSYFHFLDLQNLPLDQCEQEADRLIETEVKHPFNLAQGPLFKTTLFGLKKDEYILLLLIHHIIADGLSIHLLCHELNCLYNAFVNQHPDPLPPLPIQYADFILWQQKQKQILENQLIYWQQQLHNAPTLLELPTDRPRLPHLTFRGGRHQIEIPQLLTQALRVLCRQQGCTLYMLLLAAFNVLLNRYTGQTDILVGTPVANRTQTELEPLLGFFTNTLVIRTTLSENPTFLQLIKQVRQTTLDAHRYQNFPFHKLVQEIQKERHLSHHPLVQVVFALQNIPLPSLEFSGTLIEFHDIHNGTAKFDITLELWDQPKEIKGWFEYNTDLFDESTISGISSHFQTILEGVIADPAQRVSDLPLLTKTEQHQLLVEWNNTQLEWPQNRCVQELFEAQVECTPDALAITSEKKALTYRELNIRANQLAHQLQQLGIGAETVVAVCMEHSIEMVVGLLGILKAGGAYIPLDPSYPIERLGFILKDAGISILLTHSLLAKNLFTQDIHIIYLDTEWATMAQNNQENLPGKTILTNLAYLIYTSGSTGQPKGVAVQHNSLLNLVVWHQRVYRLTAADRATLVASPAFDASVWEIWPYLITGASLHIPNPEIRFIPQKLIKWLADKAITFTFLPTPLAESVLSLFWPPHLKLRFLLTGGDKLHCYPSALLSFKLVNHYGPTENTVVTTYGFISDQEPSHIPPIIGRPIHNTQVYILNPNMQPVPIGVAGELYIGGVGLARGYFHCPGLTAEYFIPNPFSHKPGERLYRTGDIARYLPDGNIEFIGRFDNQVKIRGFRIELGEIEIALSQHPLVKKALVLVQKDRWAHHQLVAYIVPADGVNLPDEELHQFLKNRLPGYMMPAVFITLETFPLTANGKIDRRALPESEELNTFQSKDFVPPTTPIQLTLTTVWTEVLGLDHIGIRDNFFLLGGHSLLATQVVSRIRELLRVDLPLRICFETPTIEGLERIILEQQKNQTNTSYQAVIPKINLTDEEVLLSTLDQLSDKEIDKLLNQYSTKSRSNR